MSDFRIRNGVASIVYNGVRHFFSDIPSGLPTNAVQTPKGIRLEYDDDGDVINLTVDNDSDKSYRHYFRSRDNTLYSISERYGQFFETDEIKLFDELTSPEYRILEDGSILDGCDFNGDSNTYVTIGGQIALMKGDECVIQNPPKITDMHKINVKPGTYYQPVEIIVYSQVGLTLIFTAPFYSYMAPLILTKVSKYCVADEAGNEYVINKNSTHDVELISGDKKIKIRECIDAKKPLCNHSIIYSNRGKFTLVKREVDGTLYASIDLKNKIFISTKGELCTTA